MNILIDNQDGLGQQDYTAYLDNEHLPKITRKLNQAATMDAWLVAAAGQVSAPKCGARVVLQRADGWRLFTGYLVAAPEQQYLGWAQGVAAWRYGLQAVDDSWLLDRNALPARTPLACRTAGEALRLLTNDVLPGGLDLSAVEELSPVNQFTVVPQKSWTEHAQELATMARASYRAHDGKLYFHEVAEQSVSVNEQDTHFVPGNLTVVQADELRNDVTIIGELEPLVYVRDYFLGNGTTLGFYLSAKPFSSKAATVFQEDYMMGALEPTLWEVNAAPGQLVVSGGELQLSGGPMTILFVEQLELAGGIVIQHGQMALGAPSSATLGGIYNGAVGDANCVAGFKVSPSGTNNSIQALINGVATGPAMTTVPGHLYSLNTQLFCNEAHRVQQTYLSSVHVPGNGRGGDPLAAALRVVLTVHDVDPNNPGTLAQAATVLFDGVLVGTPGFATYALLNAASIFGTIAFTRLQKVVDTEIRSMIPGQSFRTRLMQQLAEGGECYVTSAGELRFYPPYPPQPNEEVVVAYRSSGRAMARVQDLNSIAAHAHGSDNGRRSVVRRLKEPWAPTSMDCENAALALLDDAVQPAWTGVYRVISDFAPAGEILPGDGVEVTAPSRGANFNAIVRTVEVQVVSLQDDRSEYAIHFANDAAEFLAFKFESMILPEPLATVYTTATPSSSLYLPSLTAAMVTNVIATQITVDAGVAPPPGGGIEVRRSNDGWGNGSDGNLAGRFATQTFTLPRLSRVQGYYLRQYDASTPAKYSRYSALLYVDYPL